MTEGETMADRTVSAYLQDVSQMLGDVDPAYRAEVVAGVRDHVTAALGPEPWDEAAVHQALSRVGPPEEIAETALADAPTAAPAEAPPPLLARAWLPTVAVVLLALGLAGLLLVSSQGFAFIPGAAQQEFVSVPDPASYLSPIYLMLLLVPPIPLALVGAVLVSISPLYRPVDRVAAWLVLPWCVLPYALISVVLHAADPCAWSGSTCTGIYPATARATLLAATTIAVVGVVLVLVRLARARTMRPAAAASWWPATAVTLGLLLSSLPVVALPLTYREGTYTSASADGLVPYPGTLGAVLVPVLMTAPLWLAVVVVLVRSSLWGRKATVAGVALVPLLLLAAMPVTALSDALTPSVLAAGDAVAGAGGVLALGVAGWLFVEARRRTWSGPGLSAGTAA